MLKAVLFDMGDTLLKFGPEAQTRKAYRLIAQREPQLREVLERAIDLYSSRYKESLETLDETTHEEALDDAAFELEVALSPLERRVVIAQTIDYITVFTTPFPDVGSVLEQIRVFGLKMGIVSNVPYAGEHEEKLFRTFGIHHYFGAFAWSSDVGKLKPHEDIFHYALDGLGVEPLEAIHVGDLLIPDIVGARRAGLLGAVWIDRGDKTKPQVAPDWTIRELSELVPIIQKLFKSA